MHQRRQEGPAGPGWSEKGGIEQVLIEEDSLSSSGRSRTLRLVSNGVNGLPLDPAWACPGDHQDGLVRQPPDAVKRSSRDTFLHIPFLLCVVKFCAASFFSVTQGFFTLLFCLYKTNDFCLFVVTLPVLLIFGLVPGLSYIYIMT